MELLQIQNLNFAYGDRRILRDLSFSVERGSFLVLCGPSGCGKTTLLRLLKPELRCAAALDDGLLKLRIPHKRLRVDNFFYHTTSQIKIKEEPDSRFLFSKVSLLQSSLRAVKYLLICSVNSTAAL